ncbi:MAG: hypothetical protein HYV25_01805 [Candidatus Harrisonbacteria bacterium]|nr:hypothetical protein [Candidatus Harrisonbacteria bacterium]
MKRLGIRVMLMCAALVGLVFWAYADSKNVARADDSPAKVEAASTLPALPSGELPMHPDGMIVCCWHTVVWVIVDGLPRVVDVYKHNMEFRVRGDGWAHVSVQPGDKINSWSDQYKSAIILVPDEDAKKQWCDWFARESSAANEDKREVQYRAYPSRVLPPTEKHALNNPPK